MGVGEAGAAVEDGGDAADALGGVAVGADTRHGAGGLLAEAHGVGGGGQRLDSGERVANIPLDELVAPGDNNDLGGAEDHGADAVAVAVNVDQNAVEGERVGAGEEEVAGELAAHDVHALLGGEVGEAVVEDFLSGVEEGGGELEVGDGEGPPEADVRRALGVFEDVVRGLLRGGAVDGGEAAPGERADGPAAFFLGCPVDEFDGSRLHESS